MRLSLRPRVAAALAAIALALPASTSAQPGNGVRSLRAEQLTLQLVEEHLALTASPRNQGLAQQMIRTARDRQTQLASIIADDPAAVLRLAIGAAARAELPDAVQPFVEEETTLEGELEVLQEDYDQGGRVRYYLHTGSVRVGLHFATDAPELQTDQRVRVRGVLVGVDLAADSGSSAIQLVTTVAPYSFGEQRTLMILVNFQDLTTQPYTTTTANNLLFNSVNSFFGENSQNQTWLTGDVVGWFTIAMSSTSCDSSGIRSRAQSAATAAGVNLSNYRRFIYAFPKNACTWWGLGQIGGSTSHAWINGSLATRVVGHELGHNFGLYHAHALECGNTTLGTNCSTIDYGNVADILGMSGVVAHFNAFGKERLGWLNYGLSAPILTVTGPGTFSLDPYASSLFAPKALKILKEVNATTGRRTWYYVEYRRGINFDSGLAGNSNLASGVVVHTGSESTGDSSFILDMTPATTSWTDPALTVGNTFSDPASGVHISTVSATSSSATVDVQMGVLQCVPAAPSVSMTPTQTQWASPGTMVAWTVSVINNDNSACATNTYSVGGTVTAGWSASFSASSVTMAPGQTASTQMQVTSAADAANGFYAVQASANAGNGTPSGTANATYAVQSSYQVQLSATASGGKNRTVTSVARVTAAGTPVAGLPVTFTVVKPNGARLTSTANTDASGDARHQFRVGPKDPAGTWNITATATLNGISGTATTTIDLR